MPRLQLAPRAFDDLDRLTDFLLDGAPELVAETVPLIVGALRILQEHPLIGRPVEADLREMLNSRGRTGYIALYRYRAATDVVLVLRVRQQRELDFD